MGTGLCLANPGARLRVSPADDPRLPPSGECGDLQKGEHTAQHLKYVRGILFRHKKSPALRQGIKKIGISSWCSSPRKSLVKGERFIRSEEKQECQPRGQTGSLRGATQGSITGNSPCCRPPFSKKKIIRKMKCQCFDMLSEETARFLSLLVSRLATSGVKAHNLLKTSIIPSASAAAEAALAPVDDRPRALPGFGLLEIRAHL